MVGSDFLELCASNKVVLNKDGCLNRITVKAVIAGEGPLWPDLVVVKLLHGCPGFLFVGEGDKGVTSIVPIEVHHHPHLVDLTKLMTGAENAGTLKKSKKVTSRDISLKLFHNASPSHTTEPVHPQTDLSGVSPQISHYLSQAVVRPSQAAGHRTAADRSPEEQNPKMRSGSMGRTPLGTYLSQLVSGPLGERPKSGLFLSPRQPVPTSLLIGFHWVWLTAGCESGKLGVLTAETDIKQVSVLMVSESLGGLL